MYTFKCPDAWQAPNLPQRDAWLDYWAPLFSRIEAEWQREHLLTQVERDIPSYQDQVGHWRQMGGLPREIQELATRDHPGLNMCVLLGIATLREFDLGPGPKRFVATVYLGRRPFMSWDMAYRRARSEIRGPGAVNLYATPVLEGFRSSQGGSEIWLVPHVCAGGGLHLLSCTDGVYAAVMQRNRRPSRPDQPVSNEGSLQQAAGMSHYFDAMFSYQRAAHEEANQELVILNRNQPIRYFIDMAHTGLESGTSGVYAFHAIRPYARHLGLKELPSGSYPGTALPARMVSIGHDRLKLVGPDADLEVIDDCLIDVQTMFGFGLLQVCIVDRKAEGLSSRDLLLLDGEIYYERGSGENLCRPVHMIRWEDTERLSADAGSCSSHVFRWTPTIRLSELGGRMPWSAEDELLDLPVSVNSALERVLQHRNEIDEVLAAE